MNILIADDNPTNLKLLRAILEAEGHTVLSAGDGVEALTLLDREKIGLNVMVFSHVKLSGHGRDALLKFEQAVREHPEILECYTLMGETDFLLRIVCRDIKAYEAFFLDHLSRFPGVQSVNSSIALAVIKETTALPLATIPSTAPR